jgi:thiol-disulfide isomerase/thioredoxin
MLVLPIAKVNADSLPEKTDHEKVTIHLFYASWCSHCHDFISYFKDNYKKYEDYFEIKTYLVSTLDSTGQQTVSIPENAAIMQAVSDYFEKDDAGEKLEGAIPLIIIGDSYVHSGFGSDGTPMINEALKQYKNSKYKDKVAEIIKEKKLDTSKVSDFKNAIKVALGEDTEVTEEESKNNVVVVVAIIAILVGGFAGLIYFSRK